MSYWLIVRSIIYSLSLKMRSSIISRDSLSSSNSSSMAFLSTCFSSITWIGYPLSCSLMDSWNCEVLVGLTMSFWVVVCEMFWFNMLKRSMVPPPCF